MVINKKDGKIFAVGAIGYILIEILWRGHSHWSMAAAGGLSLLAVTKICDKLKNRSLLIKSLIGGGVITLIEFVFGVIFNIFFKMSVWDYSDIPGNFLGQICPQYSLFWCVLSFFIVLFKNHFHILEEYTHNFRKE